MKQRNAPRILRGFVGVATLLLFVIGGPFRAAGDDRASCFTILHVTDTHVCKLEGYNAELVKKRDHFGHGSEPFSQLLRTVPGQVGADALVITGDMIDFFEGEAADGTLRADQIEYFAGLLAPAKIPLWLALGNHDIQTHARSPNEVAKIGGRATTNPHAQMARAAWIRQCGCFHQGTYYARDVRLGTTRWRLYFLDNAYQVMNGPAGVNYWDVPQLEWLENELEQSPDQNAILFFHIPLNESPLAAGADAPQGIYKVLDDHPCVVAAFCGHKHKNVVLDKIKLPAGHAIAQVQTAAFGYDRDAWRTIKLGERAITVSKAGSSQADIVVDARPTP